MPRLPPARRPRDSLLDPAARQAAERLSANLDREYEAIRTRVEVYTALRQAQRVVSGGPTGHPDEERDRAAC